MEQALEFTGSNSDIYLLMGKLYLEQFNQSGTALEMFQRALSHNNWNVFTSSEGAFYAARAYLLNDRPDLAYTYLIALSNGPEYGLDFYRLLTQSALYSGRRAAAREAVLTGIERYPENTFFIRTAYELGLIPDSRYLDIISRFLQNQLAGTSSLIEALLEEHPEDIDYNLWARRYYENGGERPDYALTALLNTEDQELWDEMYQFFRNTRGTERKDLIQRFRQRVPQDIPEYSNFINEFTGYTGSLFIPEDREHRRTEYVYESGTLQYVQYYSAQDLLWRIDIEAYEPQQLTYYNQGMRSEYVYQPYPYINQVTVHHNDERHEYELGTPVLSLPVFTEAYVPEQDVSEVFSEAALVSEFNLPNRRQLVSAAITYQVLIGEQETAVQIWYYEQGSPTTMREDRNQDGMIDYVVHYNSHGSPDMGRLDADNDGYYEITEHYQDNRLYSISIDRNQNRVPELITEYIPEERQLWDMNEDGIIDCEYIEREDGFIRRYSTQMNGSMDLEVVVSESRIVSVEYENEPVTVYESGEPDVYWIGESRISGIAISSLEPGYHIINETPIYIFQMLEKTYIEVLE